MIGTWTKEELHGLALCLLAAGTVLGEGLGLGGLGLLLLAMIYRRHDIRWLGVLDGAIFPWLAGWCIWLMFGAVMVLGSGEGFLKASEISRHTSLLATPLVYLSIQVLPAKWWRRGVTLVLGLLLISAMLGLYQWFSGSQGLSFLVRVDSSIATQAQVPGGGEAAAATGFFFHRLKMAHVLVLGLGVAGCAWFISPRYRFYLTAVIAVFTFCLLGTYAKAAIAAATAAAGLAVLCLVRARARFVLVAAAISLMAGVWVSGIDIGGAATRSLEVREMIWGQAAEVIQDFPGGVGLGNYSQIIGRYYDFILPSFHVRTYPHNLLLAWWAESGLAAMAALAFVWLQLLLSGASGAANASKGWESRVLNAGLCFSLGSFWIIGLTHDVLYHPSVSLMFFGTVGWLLGLVDKYESREIE